MTKSIIPIEQYSNKQKDIIFEYVYESTDSLNILSYLSKRLTYLYKKTTFLDYVNEIMKTNSKANRYITLMNAEARGEILYKHNRSDWNQYKLGNIHYSSVSKYVRTFYLKELSLFNTKTFKKEDRTFYTRKRLSDTINYHSQKFNKLFKVVRISEYLISYLENENCDVDIEIELSYKKKHYYRKKDFIADLKNLFEVQSNVATEEDLINKRIKRYIRDSEYDYSEYLNSDYEEKKKEFMKKWGIEE